MNITHHIKSLLYKHDCIIVPEFGAFLVQYNSAQIDIAENKIYPPNRSIRFNAKLKDSDGILSNYLQKLLHISEAEAKKTISNYVEDIRISLNHLDEIVLDDIGRFSMIENQLQFTPSSTNFSVTAFGLSTFHCSKITKNEPVPSSEGTKVIALSEASTSRSSYLKYAAVGLIAIGLSSAFAFNWYVNDVEKHNQQAQIEVQNKINQKIQNAEFAIVEPLPILKIENQAKVVKPHIHIVGGAFREEANAVKKQNQLNKQGFNAKLIGKNRYGLHQVSYASFSNIEEAQIELKKIKRNHLSTAWLLVE